MTDTIRTDTLLIAWDMNPESKVIIEHARQLERELNAANERIKRLKEAGNLLCQAGAFIGWHDKVEAWNKAKIDKQ